MKTTFGIIWTMILAFVVLQLSTAQNIKTVSSWSTDKIFDVPESVIPHCTKDIVFVSNLGGNPSEKDGNGFISTLSKNGTLIKLHWITGLNAPKGMAIKDNTLYVSDIDVLVLINLETATIQQKYTATPGKFLNDVTVSPTGTVFVSDMQDDCIYKLENNSFTKWLSDPRLKKVNGLTIAQNFLYAGTANSILKIDMTTAEITTWLDNTGSIDGLEPDRNGGFIFSDWAGKTWHVDENRTLKLILDTTLDKINAADIGFDKITNTLYIPTFFDNRIMTYQMVPYVQE
jgi:sugar lactone lactonase YvrE